MSLATLLVGGVLFRIPKKHRWVVLVFMLAPFACLLVLWAAGNNRWQDLCAGSAIGWLLVFLGWFMGWLVTQPGPPEPPQEE